MTAASVRMVAFSAELRCRSGAKTQTAKQPRMVRAAPASRAPSTPCPAPAVRATITRPAMTAPSARTRRSGSAAPANWRTNAVTSAPKRVKRESALIYKAWSSNFLIEVQENVTEICTPAIRFPSVEMGQYAAMESVNATRVTWWHRYAKSS